jgi:hypothetical protein
MVKMDIINKINQQILNENKWDKLKDLDKLIKSFNEFMEEYPTNSNFKNIFNRLTMERNALSKELGIVS